MNGLRDSLLSSVLIAAVRDAPDVTLFPLNLFSDDVT